MRDDRDYKLELSSARGADAPAPAADVRASHRADARPFISVHFACCNAYVRVYRAPDAAEYLARCPKCGQTVTFAVGQGGTTARVFRVT